MHFLQTLLRELGRIATRKARDIAREIETRREAQAIQHRARVLDWNAEYPLRQTKSRLRK